MPKKRILLLGAGLVSDPFAHYFSKRTSHFLTVATEFECDGKRLMAFGSNIHSVVLDVSSQNEEVLLDLLLKHDICVSLLPYALNLAVAKLCIQAKRSLVTASYITPELEELHQKAVQAGIVIVNEAGLDPGIDHMLAMQCIDKAHQSGGKVRRFVSFCGGLPAPECSNNALRYKFSWSPKGSFLALKNKARYMESGDIIETDGDGAVLEHTKKIDFLPEFDLIGFPNRDSTRYLHIYGIQEECRTIFRGTLRYRGFVEGIKSLKVIGLLNDDRCPLFVHSSESEISWKKLISSLVGLPSESSEQSLCEALEKRIEQTGVETLTKLGLLSDRKVERKGSALDTYAYHLVQQLSFLPHERDVVILHHDVHIEFPEGINEQHSINLVVYGEPNGFSAMARTVGYTCAVIVNLILSGEIRSRGMLLPTTKEIYEPTLQELKLYGIKATHTITTM